MNHIYFSTKTFLVFSMYLDTFTELFFTNFVCCEQLLNLQSALNFVLNAAYRLDSETGNIQLQFETFMSLLNFVPHPLFNISANNPLTTSLFHRQSARIRAHYCSSSNRLTPPIQVTNTKSFNWFQLQFDVSCSAERISFCSDVFLTGRFLASSARRWLNRRSLCHDYSLVWTAEVEMAAHDEFEECFRRVLTFACLRKFSQHDWWCFFYSPIIHDDLLLISQTRLFQIDKQLFIILERSSLLVLISVIL